MLSIICSLFFFFNDTATTEIYTLSLHDALPISATWNGCACLEPTAPASSRRSWTVPPAVSGSVRRTPWFPSVDRKSTRLNSSHANISYAVFCLKKKKKKKHTHIINPDIYNELQR